jgi:hypothetical protein
LPISKVLFIFIPLSVKRCVVFNNL